MTDFKAKMHQIRFRLGLRSKPRWGSLQRSPDSLAGFGGCRGPTYKGRGGEGKGEEGRGKGREGKGKFYEPPQYLEKVYAYVCRSNCCKVVLCLHLSVKMYALRNLTSCLNHLVYMLKVVYFNLLHKYNSKYAASVCVQHRCHGELM